MSMRIALISLRALPALSEEHKHERMGGEEVQHALLAQAFIRQGHDVRLIVGDFGQPDEATYSGVQTINSRGVNLGFWRALRRADAEVYYYSCAGRLLGVVAAFCGLYKRRLVFRVASDADCDPSRVEIKRPWDRWLYHWGLHRADSILVQSERQRVDLMAHHGLQSEVAGMLVERPHDDFVQELAKSAGIDPSTIELVDCSRISNEMDEELLGVMAECWMDGSFEWALKPQS